MLPEVNLIIIVAKLKLNHKFQLFELSAKSLKTPEKQLFPSNLTRSEQVNAADRLDQSQRDNRNNCQSTLNRGILRAIPTLEPVHDSPCGPLRSSTAPLPPPSWPSFDPHFPRCVDLLKQGITTKNMIKSYLRGERVEAGLGRGGRGREADLSGLTVMIRPGGTKTV